MLMHLFGRDYEECIVGIEAREKFPSMQTSLLYTSQPGDCKLIYNKIPLR